MDKYGNCRSAMASQSRVLNLSIFLSRGMPPFPPHPLGCNPSGIYYEQVMASWVAQSGWNKISFNRLTRVPPFYGISLKAGRRSLTMQSVTSQNYFQALKGDSANLRKRLEQFNWPSTIHKLMCWTPAFVGNRSNCIVKENPIRLPTQPIYNSCEHSLPAEFSSYPHCELDNSSSRSIWVWCIKDASIRGSAHITLLTLNIHQDAFCCIGCYRRAFSRDIPNLTSCWAVRTTNGIMPLMFDWFLNWECDHCHENWIISSRLPCDPFLRSTILLSNCGIKFYDRGYDTRCDRDIWHGWSMTEYSSRYDCGCSLLPALELGEFVDVFLSEAYAWAASPLSFLSHATLPQIWIERGQAVSTSERQSCIFWNADNPVTEPESLRDFWDTVLKQPKSRQRV